MSFPSRTLGLLGLAALLTGCGATAGPAQQDGGSRVDAPKKVDTRPRVDVKVSQKDGPKRQDGPRKDTRPTTDLPHKADAPRPGDGPLKPDRKVTHDAPRPGDLPPPKPDQRRDSRPWPDQSSGQPDVWPNPTNCASVVGKACTQAGGECGTDPNVTCLLTTATRGVCTCECVPDNPQTPQNENSCPVPGRNLCTTINLSAGGTKNFCLRSCTPKLFQNDCDGDIACDPASVGLVSGSLTQAVCIFYGCTSNTDCPVITGQNCDTSGQPCPLGQLCIPFASGTTKGRCARDGRCNLPSRLCYAHTLGKASASVGDPCNDDTQCANNMKCMIEVDTGIYLQGPNQPCGGNRECCNNKCLSGFCASDPCPTDYRNGYCTIEGCAFANTLTFRACPAGSTCNLIFNGGLCQRGCSLTNAATCRGHTGDRLGDYECRSWDNLNLGGVPIAASPVCDFGTQMPCDFLQASGLDCSSVGLSGNSTQMTCRSTANQILSTYDPAGFCLDNTASGPP